MLAMIFSKGIVMGRIIRNKLFFEHSCSYNKFNLVLRGLNGYEIVDLRRSLAKQHNMYIRSVFQSKYGTYQKYSFITNIKHEKNDVLLNTRSMS